MIKLILLLFIPIFFTCSDDEGNPCIYEPTLSTEAVTDITETSATLNGVISIVSENCDVPNNAEQGFVYSTEIQPTLENIQVNVNGTSISATIDGLEPNTTYYVRAFLTNAFGEFYGNEVEFTTNEEINGLVNCDGNPVSTIVYGTQEWTVENACHITYMDGTPIPQVSDDTEWFYLDTGAWCYYNNDPTKPRLYNWFAVMGIHDNDPNTPNKEFAPEGWHVPSDNEWTTLEEHLITNGYNYDQTTTENKIAKAIASAEGWDYSTAYGTPGNNQNTNNNSGFNAFPVGIRSSNQEYMYEGMYAIFPSSTEIQQAGWMLWGRWIGWSESFTTRYEMSAHLGYTVRFVKD